MSRHFAAYFAIVGTLAFAPGGAANAGPFNMPHFNMAQPHFNMLRPQISMPHPSFPKVTTSNQPLVHIQNQVVHNNQKNKASGSPHKETPAERSIPSLGGGDTQNSSPGNASAMLVSNVSGANVSGTATPSRFRVIEDGGHFAVVERRSEKIVAGGFESYKAASAWIANHV
jgi:hypothetical protein